MATISLTEPIRVAAKRVFADRSAPPTAADFDADLKRARVLADWLDTKFTVAGVRFGFDAVIGLLPLVGDTVATIIGLFPLHIARRHGLGKWVQLRMGANLLVEWVIGSVPLIGDLFDVAFKANVRNVELLERAGRAKYPAR